MTPTFSLIQIISIDSAIGKSGVMWYDHFEKTRLISNDQIQGNPKDIHRPNWTNDVVSKTTFTFLFL